MPEQFHKPHKHSENLPDNKTRTKILAWSNAAFVKTGWPRFFFCSTVQFTQKRKHQCENKH